MNTLDSISIADCKAELAREEKIRLAIERIIERAGTSDSAWSILDAAGEMLVQRDERIARQENELQAAETLVEINHRLAEKVRKYEEMPPRTLAEHIEHAIVAALDRHHGNRTHAARELGISVRTLQRWLRARASRT